MLWSQVSDPALSPSRRWRGISAQARWVMEARERAHQQPSSAELLETKPLGDDASAYVAGCTIIERGGELAIYYQSFA